MPLGRDDSATVSVNCSFPLEPVVNFFTRLPATPLVGCIRRLANSHLSTLVDFFRMDGVRLNIFRHDLRFRGQGFRGHRRTR